MTIKDVVSEIADDMARDYRAFCSETDIETIRAKIVFIGSMSSALNSYFLICIVLQVLQPFGIDLNSPAFVPIYLVFVMFLVGGQLLVILFTMERGPYGQHSQVQKIYKVGCLYKSVADVGALCIAVILRYSFEVPQLCFFWLSLVAMLQIIWKVQYGPCDFWFSDVIFGSIMRAVIVYQEDYDDYVFMALYLFYGSIIYHRHWSSPSSTTIFCKTEDVLQIQKSTEANLQNKQLESMNDSEAHS